LNKKMILIQTIIQVMVCFLIFGLTGSTEYNKGAENMALEGGTKGEIPFPHYRHQEILGNCTVCHKLFMQKSGSVENLKAKGVLKKKQVMNKLCIKCHRAERKAGKPHGPTTCTKCHVR